MDKTFRGILDLICGKAVFVLTFPLIFAAWVMCTLLLGPSWRVSLSLIGLGIITAVIEFRREWSDRAT